MLGRGADDLPEMKRSGMMFAQTRARIMPDTSRCTAAKHRAAEQSRPCGMEVAQPPKGVPTV